MLGKMLMQGLIAAALIGSAAAVYARATDNGPLASTAMPDRPKDAAGTETGNGYLRPTEGNLRDRKDERRHDTRSERHRQRHDRNHDDDDD